MLLQHVSFHIKPSSGSYIQCLAKITYLVPFCVSLLMLSVLWRHILTCCACVLCTVQKDLLHGAQYTRTLVPDM